MKFLILLPVLFSFGLVQARAADKDLPLPADQKFVVQAVECTVAEIKFAETAIGRTTNPEVKAFAQKIKDEHNVCLKKSMETAGRFKLAVVEGLSKENQEVVNRLSRLEGKAFDQEYVQGVIDRHEKMINSCKEQLELTKTEEIQSMCKEAVTVIKGHLDAARKVQANIK